MSPETTKQNRHDPPTPKTVVAKRWLQVLDEAEGSRARTSTLRNYIALIRPSRKTKACCLIPLAAVTCHLDGKSR